MADKDKIRLPESAVDRDLVKAAMKEGIKEWLNETYSSIGHWTVRTFLVAGIGALMYFILVTGGWHK